MAAGQPFQKVPALKVQRLQKPELEITFTPRTNIQKKYSIHE
jgi:hypothetical protein